MRATALDDMGEVVLMLQRSDETRFIRGLGGIGRRMCREPLKWTTSMHYIAAGCSYLPTANSLSVASRLSNKTFSLGPGGSAASIAFSAKSNS